MKAKKKRAAAKPPAAPRPKLPKASEEMNRWAAFLAAELESWPQVTAKPMFGLLGFYRRKVIFAALPRTRALETPNSVSFKLTQPRPRSKQNAAPGADWSSFEIVADADLCQALHLLDEAYRAAAPPRPRKK